MPNFKGFALKREAARQVLKGKRGYKRGLKILKVGWEGFRAAIDKRYSPELRWEGGGVVGAMRFWVQQLGVSYLKYVIFGGQDRNFGYHICLILII